MRFPLRRFMMLCVLRDNTPARKFYKALGEKPIEIGTQTLIEIANGWKDLQRLAGS
jgi:ribosomal protein S18 acetylase RimI-like enzyme